MTENLPCPCCHSADVTVFYEVDTIPVHSVLLLPTREEALTYPTGTMRLGFCQTCGFIYNTAYDASLQHEYSDRYEETQGFSPTFNTFAVNLATRLIESYDLHNKDIVEIGCGKGEFITLLCQMGNNRGVGIDPSYVKSRSLSKEDARVTFVKEFYSERHASYACDFLCCKMTLEHIDKTADFLHTVALSLRDKPNAIIFFQIPEVTRILSDAGFWDVYYEHCSYFSAGSLARLFRSQGFDVLDLATEYDNQYLMIEARTMGGNDTFFAELEDDLDKLKALVSAFPQATQQKCDYWRETIRQMKADGKRVVLWGSGSKGVAFLTTLGIRDEIEYTVDINPNKHGTYMAGTGQEIASPAFMQTYQPDAVIVMNPVYRDEIQRTLAGMGLHPEVMTV